MVNRVSLVLWVWEHTCTLFTGCWIGASFARRGVQTEGKLGWTLLLMLIDGAKCITWRKISIIDKRIRVSRPFCVGKVCNLECQTSSQVMTPWSFILISSGGLVHEEIFHSNHNTSFLDSKMKLNIFSRPPAPVNECKCSLPPSLLYSSPVYSVIIFIKKK